MINDICKSELGYVQNKLDTLSEKLLGLSSDERLCKGVSDEQGQWLTEAVVDIKSAQSKLYDIEYGTDLIKTGKVKGNKVGLEVVSVKKPNIYDVDVEYKLKGVKFVVKWSCFEKGSNTVFDKFVLKSVKSKDFEMLKKASMAIAEGKGSNEANELYLSIRDTFTENDCHEVKWNMNQTSFKITDSKAYITTSQNKIIHYRFVFVVNDAFVLELNNENEFKIPFSGYAKHNHSILQDIASAGVDIDDLVEKLEIPKDIDGIMEKYKTDVELDRV